MLKVQMETFKDTTDKVGVLKKEFKIFRWNPDVPSSKPYPQSYFLDLTTCGPMVIYKLILIYCLLWCKNQVLDALQKIKSEEDSTLTMNIDGVNTVACLKPIDTDTTKPTFITPLPHMFVIKDLVVDLTNFYNQYRYIHSYYIVCTVLANNCSLTCIQGYKLTKALYECILCACCSTSCPSYWWNEEFLGPAALIHAYRWKLYRCRTIKNCTACCPKSLNPASAINKMKAVEFKNERNLRRIDGSCQWRI
ncbi:hypothetical protein MKW92_012131 [Papaver armeniacum]|nr:hypothetical protein MKW92_012131 [Papaver armeniacum]